VPSASTAVGSGYTGRWPRLPSRCLFIVRQLDKSRKCSLIKLIRPGRVGGKRTRPRLLKGFFLGARVGFPCFS